jgi:hypothetical protein
VKTKIRTTAAAQRAAGYIGKLLPVAAAAFALHAGSASATTLDWSYTGPDGLSGSGAFDATALNPSDPTAGFMVVGIAGTANGQTITGLNDFENPDDFVFPPNTPTHIGVDSNGFGFTVADGTEYNLYEDDGIFNTAPFECGVVYCLISSTAPTIALTSFSVTFAAGVPEPATWAMMVLGLGGLGAALRSRRRPVALTA